MITIDEKLYVTKEINGVLIDYAKENVLKKLLLKFSFRKKNNKEKVTDLIESVGYYNGDMVPSEQHLDLVNLIHNFLKGITKEELTALHFWMLNENYDRYVEESEINNHDENFETKFGRELAYKIYEPESSWLNDELDEALLNLLINFASEFDFSIVDNNTKKGILHTINSHYC